MNNLMLDMLRDVVDRGVDRTRALKGLRALSRIYGGQQLYIPQKKTSVADEIIAVMADEIGDIDAEKIYDIIACLYGGVQWYVPLERSAFRDFIAREIYNGYDGTKESMRKYCIKYSMSFSQVYRLYYEAKEKAIEKKLQGELFFADEDE